VCMCVFGLVHVLYAIGKYLRIVINVHSGRQLTSCLSTSSLHLSCSVGFMN